MAKKIKPNQVRVKVAGGINPKSKELEGQPLHEDGTTYQPGAEFELDAQRAEALGDRVEILGPVKGSEAAPEE